MPALTAAISALVVRSASRRATCCSARVSAYGLVGFLLLTGRPRHDCSLRFVRLNFSSFYPKHIGVIDYHGSHRNYRREELGGINLNLDQEEDRYRQSSLYNLYQIAAD